jgi:hypothetical protein
MKNIFVVIERGSGRFVRTSWHGRTVSAFPTRKKAESVVKRTRFTESTVDIVEYGPIS